jgi:signal transduction histidine kinase
MFIDNSKEVINKRLLEINAFKDELLATVTHDLKTPLNCMTQLLESSELEINIEELKKNNKITLKSCYLLLNLIHDILDYCQI